MMSKRAMFLALLGASGAVVGACASGRGAQPASGPTAGRPAARTDTAVRRQVAEERNVGGTIRANAVAVPPFRIARRDTTFEPLAYALADMLTSDLALSPQLTLVERARLGDVLRELQLAGTGRVDSATAPRVGRLISARRLVLGSIDTIAGTRDIRVGVRLANVQSGLVERSIDARAPLSNILAAEKTLAFRVFEELGIVLTPAERVAVSQRPTENLAALLAFGRGVRFQLLGDYANAAREFRRAQQLDPNFRHARERAAAATTLAEAPVRPAAPTTPAPTTTNATTGTRPTAATGARPTSPSVTAIIDRINRPLDVITSVAHTSGTAADPAFPTTAATIILTVIRP